MYGERREEFEFGKLKSTISRLFKARCSKFRFRRILGGSNEHLRTLRALSCLSGGQHRPKKHDQIANGIGVSIDDVLG